MGVALLAMGALLGAARVASAEPDPAAGASPIAAGVPALAFTVDTADDSLDASPGDGACADVTGHCSLRAAIEEVDRRGSARTSTIQLTVDPVLTIPPSGSDDNSSGDLNVSARLEIHGNKHTIRGSQLDRVIDHTAGKLSLVKVVLTAGVVTGTSPQGGAIRTNAELAVLGSKLNLNRATGPGAEGGAIYGGPSSSIVVGTSQLKGNGANAMFDVGMYGGAISAHGRLTVLQSLIDGNRSSGAWLGHSGDGGGVAAFGPTVAISDSTISDNVSKRSGGGVFVQGSALTMTRSTVRGNIASTDHFGGFGDGGGIAVTGHGPATIDSSTISANISSGPGAGVALSEGDGVLTNVTLADNLGSGDGVALWVGSGSGHLVSSTVSGNRMTPLTGSWSETPASLAGTVLTLAGTLVDSRYLTACAIHPTSEGWNRSTDSSCALSGPSDEEGVASVLGALGANGGPTATHLPYANSPVTDAIPVGTTGLCDGTIAADQRGTARPQGTACDIGAVEGTGPSVAPLALLVDTAADTSDTLVGDGVCLTPAGQCSLRAAIEETNARPTADVITIASSFDIVRNGGGLLMATDQLTIHGNGATLDANFGGAVLTQSGNVLTVDHLTLEHGDNYATGPVAVPFDGAGGGIASAGDLTVTDSTISDNGGNYIQRGAAILHRGATRVTIARTSVVRNRGAAGAGVTISPTGEATITDSTFAHNLGAPLVVDRATMHMTTSSIVNNNTGIPYSWAINDSNATIDLTSVTVADSGRFVYGGNSDIRVRGTILDGGSPTLPVCVTAITSLGYNTASDASCGLDDPTDQPSTEVELASLTDNGGPTPTRLPVTGSVAIDAIPVGTPGLCDAGAPDDQRGVARPQGAACDIGATEGSAAAVMPLDLVVDSPVDARDAKPGDGICDDGTGHCTFRAAVDETNAGTRDDTITVAPGVDPVLRIPAGPDDQNAGNGLDSFGNLTIHGGGATLDAGGEGYGIGQHVGTLHVDHLTVTHGVDGAILAAGELDLDHVNVVENTTGYLAPVSAPSGTIVDSTVSHNVSTFPASGGPTGGGINLGTGTILRTTIDHNAAERGAAVMSQYGVTIIDSTISDNVVSSGDGNPPSDYSVIEITGTIIDSTIAGNTGPHIFPQYSYVAPTTVTVQGTILDASSGAVCAAPLTSLGHNLVSDDTCALSGPGDIQSTPARLGPLADNGGATQTRLPFVDSAAVDAVPIGTAGLCDGSVPVDQRGSVRPQGVGCDIGAVERGA